MNSGEGSFERQKRNEEDARDRTLEEMIGLERDIARCRLAPPPAAAHCLRQETDDFRCSG
jgi:hypothetical protein